MPADTPSLLGLGLKYCIKKPRPTNNLDTTIEQFKTDIRRTYFFKANNIEEVPGSYIPCLYIKGDWEPPEANKRIEQCITNFESELRRRQSACNKPTLSNLTPRHWKLIEELKYNDDHIIIKADKNLGGSILDRSVYTSKGISEHLGDTNMYKHLTKRQANGANNKLQYK